MASIEEFATLLRIFFDAILGGASYLILKDFLTWLREKVLSFSLRICRQLTLTIRKLLRGSQHNNCLLSHISGGNNPIVTNANVSRPVLVFDILYCMHCVGSQLATLQIESLPRTGSVA